MNAPGVILDLFILSDSEPRHFSENLVCLEILQSINLQIGLPQVLHGLEMWGKEISPVCSVVVCLYLSLLLTNNGSPHKKVEDDIAFAEE